MSAPPGHDPSVSTFSGGDHVQITPLQGGGSQEGGQFSIAGLLGQGLQSYASGAMKTGPIQLASSLITPQLASVDAKVQPSAAAAAAVASQVVMQKTGDLQMATDAGVLAASSQVQQVKDKTALANTRMSDADALILHTARDQEKNLAISEGTKAYNASINAKEPESVARQKQVEAAVKAIKDYRLTHKYEDKTVSMSATQTEAKEILGTTDPIEKEIGAKAFKGAYDVAIKSKSDQDAKDIGTIAQVEAIKNYRNKAISIPEFDQAGISLDEAKKILQTDDEYEKILILYARTQALKQAKERGITNKKQLDAHEIIGAAQYIQMYRGDKKILKQDVRVPIKSVLINTLEKTPLYLEYTAVKKELSSPYRALLEREHADASIGKQFEINMKAKMLRYEERQRKLWYSEKNTNAPIIPQTKGINSLNPGEVITAYSRLTYVLPVTTSDLIIVPPINGSIQSFMNILETLGELGVFKTDLKIKENVVIVCTVPFYSSKSAAESIRNNSILLSFALNIMEKNPGQFNVLADNSTDGFFVGSNFIKYSQSGPLINLMEPSYVVYPYKRSVLPGIVVSSSSSGLILPGPSNSKMHKLQSVYTSKDFGNPKYLIYKPNLKTESAPGYFVVRGSLNPMNVPKEKIGVCGLANYSLAEMIQTLHPTREIHLSGLIIGFRLRVEGQYEPLCTSDKIIEIGGQKFVGALDIFVGPVGFFEIAGNLYKIRKTDKNDAVYKDWLKGSYSSDEADLLNVLNLSPGIMDKIFPIVFDENGTPVGMPWKSWVAEFLAVITVQNKSLKTHRETMIVRNFLEQVRAYFLEQQLKHDLEESDSDDEDAIKRQHGLIEPSGEGVDLLEGEEEFKDIKRKWGELDIYENTNTGEWICSLILVNKQTEKQLYKTIGVPTTDFNDITARPALLEKIKSLKKKYPDWIFIY